MKKNIKLLLCLVGVLALLQVALTKGHTEGEEATAPEAVAVADQATDTAADAVAADSMELSGTITSIEPETSTIIIEYAAEGKEATASTAPFKVTEETAITSAEMPVELSDLKAGDQVNVVYTLDAEGAKVIQALKVQN